jgi:peptidoglycan/LPS O-acetylase OafA/YrhL
MSGGRVRSIDILRGFAILWVILFHLWGDIKFFPPVPLQYYDRFVSQVGAGAPPLHIFSAVTDIFFRDGFEGVPLFMMLSGLSLTMVAYRTGGVASWPRFFLRRARKLLIPYWVGVALTYAVLALIAWRETVVPGDAGFTQQFQHGITISLHTHLTINAGVIFASIALVPRLLEDRWFFAPQLALWFVGLLAQYYLLFPLLFAVMKRIGLAPFLLVTFALTVGANWWVLQQYHYLELQFRLVTGWVPFRLFEFTAGMAIGAIIADPERARILGQLRRWPAIVAALALGFAAHTGGDLMIGDWALGYWQALAIPLMTLGLALLVLPLVTKVPSRVDLWAPARALAAVGVMSYTVLIINDPMRLIASQLRVERVPAGEWWFFTVAIYVPVTLLLAWPLASVLGLLPKRQQRAVPQRIERPDEAFGGVPAG